MSRRDWFIVLALSTAALVAAWPNLRESTLGLLLTGRCDAWVGRGRTGGCREDPERREERRRDAGFGAAPDRAIPRRD